MTVNSIKIINENRIHEFKKIRLRFVKKIDDYVQKNNMGDQKKQRKLQKKMENIYHTITKKQKSLETYKQSKSREIKPTNRFSFLFNFLLIFIILFFLQIFIVIKSSVFLYTIYDFSTWLSFISSLLTAFLVVILYLCYFSWRKLKQIKIKKMIFISIIPIILCSLFLIFYESKGNIKTDSIPGSFLKLHPFLRISVNMLILFDRNLIVTDIERTNNFYSKTDIPTTLKSLHHPQSDGYIHAVDIRTKYRNEFRNLFVKWFFKILGFEVLRHIGTADHLHVCI